LKRIKTDRGGIGNQVRTREAFTDHTSASGEGGNSSLSGRIRLQRPVCGDELVEGWLVDD